jgi:hypothetical protein
MAQEHLFLMNEEGRENIKKKDKLISLKIIRADY